MRNKQSLLNMLLVTILAVTTNVSQERFKGVRVYLGSWYQGYNSMCLENHNGRRLRKLVTSQSSSRRDEPVLSLLFLLHRSEPQFLK